MEDVVVVGAGWAGLAAATELRRRGCDPLVLEGSGRFGGAATTVRDGDWLLEGGPHAFFPETAPMRRFLEGHAGPAASLVAADPFSRDRFVVRRGRRMALPRTPPGLLTTRVLGPVAKLRLLVEPFVRAGSDPDESVERFCRRRFGRGVLPLVDAMVTGVFAGDPKRLASRHALPRAFTAEEAHGSVLRGMARRTSGKRGPLTAPRDGMGPWLDGVASSFRTSFRTVVRLDGHGPFRLVCDDRVVEARRVVLAVQPEQAGKMLEIDVPTLPKAQVASVGLGWRPEDAPRHVFRGYGVLCPESEGRFTLGTLYESCLFPGRAPEGGVLVRALVGGRRHPERAALPDDELTTAALDDVSRLHGVDAAPDWTRVIRPPPIPQMEVGHERRLTAVQERVQALPGVAVAGWGWRGVGISDVVGMGQEAAASVLQGRLDTA